MSDYSRYTTTKGQLLLNIKPPSGSFTPRNAQPRGIEQIGMVNSKYVPYVGLNTNQNYQPSQPAYQIQRRVQNQTPIQRQAYYPQRNYVGVAPSYTNQSANHAYLDYSSQNTRQINNPYRPTNYPITESRVQPFAARDRQNQQLAKGRGYRQPELGKFKQPLSHRDEIQQKERAIRKQIDKTICCFPAFWLVLLLLGVVFASFFILLNKSNNTPVVVDPNADVNNTNATSGSNSSNTNTSISTNTNTGTTTPSNNSSNSGSGSSSTTQNSDTSFQFPPQTGTSSDTSFMFPPKHRHSLNQKHSYALNQLRRHHALLEQTG